MTTTFAGRRIVVVGGAGFVGGNLVRSLVTQEPAQIVVIDNLLSANRTDVLDLPSVRFIEGSIADDATLDQIPLDTDMVFHLATFHGNQSSIRDPLADHANNLLTSLKLFDRLSKHSHVERVVYSSAGCTVAEKTYEEARPTTEEDPVSLHLDSPYQISKVVGEMYANYFHAHEGLPVVIARFQNVYGPGEILGAGRWRGTRETVWRNVVPTFVYRALKGWPLRLENEGLSTRDFIFVDDVVRGLEICAAIGDAGEVYNLASGRETTIRAVAETVNRLVDTPTEVELVPRRDWDHSGRRFGSTEKSRRTLGFEALVELEDGLRRTIEWSQLHMAEIEASINRHKANLELVGTD